MAEIKKVAVIGAGVMGAGIAAATVAAGLLAWLFGGGSALALALGAAVGVFGPRLSERYRSGRQE